MAHRSIARPLLLLCTKRYRTSWQTKAESDISTMCSISSPPFCSNLEERKQGRSAPTLSWHHRQRGSRGGGRGWRPRACNKWTGEWRRWCAAHALAGPARCGLLPASPDYSGSPAWNAGYNRIDHASTRRWSKNCTRQFRRPTHHAVGRSAGLFCGLRPRRPGCERGPSGPLFRWALALCFWSRPPPDPARTPVPTLPIGAYCVHSKSLAQSHTKLFDFRVLF